MMRGYNGTYQTGWLPVGDGWRIGNNKLVLLLAATAEGREKGAGLRSKLRLIGRVPRWRVKVQLSDGVCQCQRNWHHDGGGGGVVVRVMGKRLMKDGRRGQPV